MTFEATSRTGQNTQAAGRIAADVATTASTALMPGRPGLIVTQTLQNFPDGPELWRLYRQQSSVSAENALVECYLPLVGSILSRLSGTLPDEVDREDLYSAGLLGLLTALRKFNPATGVPFDSYARQRIRGAMLDEIRRMDWVPRAIRAKAKQCQQVSTRLEQELGRTPTRTESAQAMNLTMAEYDELVEETRPAQFVRLDSPCESDPDSEVSLGDAFAEADQVNPFEQAASSELRQVIFEKLKQMPQIQQQVLTLYYIEGLYMHEIATALKLTEGRICQIQSQAIQSLRSYLKRFENGLEDTAATAQAKPAKRRKRTVRIQDKATDTRPNFSLLTTQTRPAFA
ncbi:MAG TPA: FliA/WhiG family RNA polymerase sigma factor [Candidatus Acidoferrales bacterium]|nr:FliA/WhiG family RNA polymerase sigma factor [Candidatus Acidoferrales bacterium]